jgi:hypothetical protein
MRTGTSTPDEGFRGEPRTIQRECFGRSRYVRCPSSACWMPIESSSTREDECFGKLRYDNAEYRGPGVMPPAKRSIPGQYLGGHRCDAPSSAATMNGSTPDPSKTRGRFGLLRYLRPGHRRGPTVTAAMRTAPKPHQADNAVGESTAGIDSKHLPAGKTKSRTTP